MPKYKIVTEKGTYHIETEGQSATPFEPLSEGRKSMAMNGLSDDPERQPGFLEKLNEMLKPVARPQSAGDVMQSVIPEASGAGGMLRTLAKGVQDRLPGKGTVGRALEAAGEGMPTALDPARPARHLMSGWGKKLQTAAEDAPSPNASGTPSIPRAANGPYQQWKKPTATDTRVQTGPSEPSRIIRPDASAVDWATRNPSGGGAASAKVEEELRQQYLRNLLMQGLK